MDGWKPSKSAPIDFPPRPPHVHHHRSGVRPPPRAGCSGSFGRRWEEGVNRAIMTISEDTVVSVLLTSLLSRRLQLEALYVDEESEKIEKLLQQKRSQGHAAAVGDSSENRASGEGGAVGQAKAPDCGDAIDMSLVALALQNLFLEGGGEIVPKCAATSSERFYQSEDGNEALAAGMFDISVVCAELGEEEQEDDDDHDDHDDDDDDDDESGPPMMGTVDVDGASTGDSGVQSVEPSPNGLLVPGAPATASSGQLTSPKPTPKRLSAIKVDDSYRPRTSSNAPEPDFEMDEDFPSPISLSPHKSKRRPGPVAGILIDDSYRPRTSSKAIDPEEAGVTGSPLRSNSTHTSSSGGSPASSLRGSARESPGSPLRGSSGVSPGSPLRQGAPQAVPWASRHPPELRLDGTYRPRSTSKTSMTSEGDSLELGDSIDE